LFKNLILYLPVTEATNKLARTFVVDFTDYMRPLDIICGLCLSLGVVYKYQLSCHQFYSVPLSGADPGFPVGGVGGKGRT
jgi:hypothetical protein